MMRIKSTDISIYRLKSRGFIVIIGAAAPVGIVSFLAVIITAGAINPVDGTTEALTFMDNGGLILK
jgi:hypothetical protein